MFILNGDTVEITRFPDNTFKFNIDKSKIKSSNELQWNFESMEELFTLIGLSDKLKDFKTQLRIPYLPNARMDKTVNNEEGFMLKYFMKTVDKLGFESITILDPHSSVYKNFSKKSKWKEDEYTLRSLVFKTILNVKAISNSEDITLVYPDKGSKARYTSLIGETKNLVGVKSRSEKTGEIVSFDLLGDIPEGPVLIVDDICSKGGTFYFASKRLREKGYTGEIYLYVTHMENSIFEGELLEENSEISRIFTTDSILTLSHKKITTYKI